MNQLSPLATQPGRNARLGHNHGYRIAGDVACLNAEVAVAHVADELAAQWALQLWACDRPYAGGALAGTKVAEALLDVPHANARSLEQPQYCYAETFARLPVGDREYSMVLVLAARSANAQEEVLDFANYPAREHFQVPALRGAADARLSADHASVTLQVERVDNPRGPENLSGTLSLELWALPAAYGGGSFAGQPLAGVEIGRLAGQTALERLDYTLALAPGAKEHWQRGVTLMLREWTADGYVTRDYRGVAAPVRDQAAPGASVPVATRVERANETENSASPHKSKPSAAATKREVAAKRAPDGMTRNLVSIQHATLEQLTQVPGLNRKLASEIIKARPFRSLDELSRVRGIGDATLRRLRSVLSL